MTGSICDTRHIVLWEIHPQKNIAILVGHIWKSRFGEGSLVSKISVSVSSSPPNSSFGLAVAPTSSLRQTMRHWRHCSGLKLGAQGTGSRHLVQQLKTIWACTEIMNLSFYSIMSFPRPPWALLHGVWLHSRIFPWVGMTFKVICAAEILMSRDTLQILIFTNLTF